MIRLALSALVCLAGCSSVGSTAIRTGGARQPPYSGPVALFAAGEQPAGQDLGVVEVYGSNQDGDVEVLVPLFVRRAAQLGGDAAVIDDVRAQYRIFTSAVMENYTYPCGYRAVCVGSRVYPTNQEVMTVILHGRAMKMAPR